MRTIMMRSFRKIEGLFRENLRLSERSQSSAVRWVAKTIVILLRPPGPRQALTHWSMTRLRPRKVAHPHSAPPPVCPSRHPKILHDEARFLPLEPREEWLCRSNSAAPWRKSPLRFCPAPFPQGNPSAPIPRSLPPPPPSPFSPP